MATPPGEKASFQLSVNMLKVKKRQFPLYPIKGKKAGMRNSRKNNSSFAGKFKFETIYSVRTPLIRRGIHFISEFCVKVCRAALKSKDRLQQII